MRHRIRDLRAVARDGFHREARGRDQVGERTPVDEFRDNIEVVADLSHLMNRANIRMA